MEYILCMYVCIDRNIICTYNRYMSCVYQADMTDRYVHIYDKKEKGKYDDVSYRV